MTMFIPFREGSPGHDSLLAVISCWQLVSKLPNACWLSADPRAPIRGPVHKANERASGLAFAQYIRQHVSKHAVNTVMGKGFRARRQPGSFCVGASQCRDR